LQTAAVFAVGFFARPVGAWMLGIYADRVGRKAALTLSVAMMCLGSLVIALTPSAARIGIAAPSILLLARVLQGLSLGGEYGASATYMSEMAGRRHRGFWSSFNYVTLIGGQLLALAVLIILQRLLSKHDMTDWGWRIAFLIGAALAVVAYWLRRHMAESVAFAHREASSEQLSLTVHLFTHYPRETFTILGLTAGGSMLFYVDTTYMQTFLRNTAGFSIELASEISAAALFICMLLQPIFGWASDKIARKSMLLFAFGSAALFTWPIMSALATAHSAQRAFILIMLSLLSLSAYTSISAVVKAGLFPPMVRTLGVALPYALANAAFGGTAEYVALWFKSRGLESGFYVYATVLASFAFFVTLILFDSRSRFDGEQNEQQVDIHGLELPIQSYNPRP